MSRRENEPAVRMSWRPGTWPRPTLALIVKATEASPMGVGAVEVVRRVREHGDRVGPVPAVVDAAARDEARAIARRRRGLPVRAADAGDDPPLAGAEHVAHVGAHVADDQTRRDDHRRAGVVGHDGRHRTGRRGHERGREQRSPGDHPNPTTPAHRGAPLAGVAREHTGAGRRPVRPAAERPLGSSSDGTWRSLVAHLLWEQGVAGSNPAVPIACLQGSSSSDVQSELASIPH